MTAKTRHAMTAAGVLLAAVFLGAAGTLSPQDLRHIKTVAVISALGNSFQFERVPDTPFALLGPPEARFLETSDWGLDAHITKAVTENLAKRLKVERIAFRPGDFSTWNGWLLRRATLDLNGDPNIDAYVLVLRDWRSDDIGESVHQLGGLGLYRKDRASGHAKLGVFASYRIVVVDALTGNTLASRAALLPDGKLPWIPVDAALWPKTQNDLTEAQRSRLTADEKKLIDATLLRALLQMNLTR